MTRVVWNCLTWVDQHHQWLLVGLITCASLHVFFSLLLVVGAMLNKQFIFLPWLFSEMVIIVLMVISFTCWTFVSLFIDLLMAIVFPMVAGLVLGLWICLWRQVHWSWLVMGEMVLVTQEQEGYKIIPAHRHVQAKVKT